ncbi:hypothetical protein F5884DRAFT_88982 [Xylogone sp. PMI_703]|nr:hypothetical protein F5884DRAFT_88982 [Xylogone sp. PMI_703]
MLGMIQPRVTGADNGYMPHPAPSAAGQEDDDSSMGSTLSLLKTLIIPAIISLVLYLLLSYLIVPVWKRYRNRYSQYIPLDRITNQTSSLRQRLQAALIGLLMPSSWRADRNTHRFSATPEEDGANSDFDEDDGEELYEVDQNRREAISLDAQRRVDVGRRLSRDLEEGFMDDSDDENGSQDDRRSLSR